MRNKKGSTSTESFEWRRGMGEGAFRTGTLSKENKQQQKRHSNLPDNDFILLSKNLSCSSAEYDVYALLFSNKKPV